MLHWTLIFSYVCWGFCVQFNWIVWPDILANILEFQPPLPPPYQILILLKSVLSHFLFILIKLPACSTMQPPHSANVFIDSVQRTGTRSRDLLWMPPYLSILPERSYAAIANTPASSLKSPRSPTSLQPESLSTWLKCKYCSRNMIWLVKFYVIHGLSCRPLFGSQSSFSQISQCSRLISMPHFDCDSSILGSMQLNRSAQQY